LNIKRSPVYTQKFINTIVEDIINKRLERCWCIA
jgi:hypothetical protein